MVLALWGPAALALDSVRTVKGSLTGTITAAGADEITLRRSATQEDKIPINQVISVRYDGEPPRLNQARTGLAAGRYHDALAVLDEVEKEPLTRDEIRREIAYLRMAAGARLALAGQGDPRVAGKTVREFVQANPNSMYYYPATELLGELFAKIGAYDNALAEYDKLAARPWPDYKMRSGIARAAIFRQQQKYDAALAAYDEVLAAAGAAPQDKLVAAQRLEAQLGKAQGLSEMGRAEEGIGLIHEIIAAADAEDAPLFARAYNVLGELLRKSQRDKEALLAYLHVDVLYFTQSQPHAEALRNLAELWEAAGQPERAAAARRTLEEKYNTAKSK